MAAATDTDIREIKAAIEANTKSIESIARVTENIDRSTLVTDPETAFLFCFTPVIDLAEALANALVGGRITPLFTPPRNKVERE